MEQTLKRRPQDKVGKVKTDAQQKAYDTRYSQAVTHPSTNRARRCLTSQIGRDGVYSAWYGRRRSLLCLVLFYTAFIPFLHPAVLDSSFLVRIFSRRVKVFTKILFI